MNNDRFKYRVWDEKERRYVELAFFVSSEGTLYIHFPLYMIAYSNPHIIEQCTGVRDINGELIYEGDIVQGFVGLCNERFFGAICWSEEKVSWMISKDFCITAFDGIEIIGNIHQNGVDDGKTD